MNMSGQHALEEKAIECEKLAVHYGDWVGQPNPWTDRKVAGVFRRAAASFRKMLAQA